MGAIESMMNSLKENRRVRGENKTMRDRSGDYSFRKSESLEFSDSMTEEEHQKHRAEWAKRKRKSNIQLAILFLGIIGIIAAFLIWLAV